MSREVNNQKILEEQNSDTGEILSSLLNKTTEQLRQIFNKQFDLYTTVYQPRILKEHNIDSCYEYFTYLDKQNVLSIINELWELNEQDISKSYTVDDFLEIAFEVSDIFHFIYQGIILQYQKIFISELESPEELTFEDQITTPKFLEWFNNESNVFSDELYYAEHDMVDQEITFRASREDYNPQSEFTEIFLLVSEILNYVDWKHWKTYTPELNVTNQHDILSLYYMILCCMGNMLGYLKLTVNDVIEMYNIKEQINRDRQNNNY